MPLAQIKRMGFAPGDLELPLESANAAVKPRRPALGIDRRRGHLGHEGHRVIAAVVADENASGLLVRGFLTLCYQASDVGGFQPNTKAVVGRAEAQIFFWYELEHRSKNLKKAGIGHYVALLCKETDRFTCSLGDSFDPRREDRMPASDTFAREGLRSVLFEIIRQQRRDH